MTACTRASRSRGLRIALIGSLLFVLVVTALNSIAKWMLASLVASGLQARVTVELTSAMLAEAGLLLLARAFLRRQGLSLGSLGLRRSAPAAGWIAGALLAVLFVGFNLALPLRGNTRLAEVSWFHVYNAVLAGAAGGLLEETLFRGFLIDQLRRSGFGTTAQVAVSSAAYGAAHAAWGLTSGAFTLQLVGGAVIGTTVFGFGCAAVYLLSRRSLVPVILSHGLIDLCIEPWLFLAAVSLARR
jgi:membrane protease YdiL (CAAX protease family)